jgi:hypothetical protein
MPRAFGPGDLIRASRQLGISSEAELEKIARLLGLAPTVDKSNERTKRSSDLRELYKPSVSKPETQRVGQKTRDRIEQMSQAGLEGSGEQIEVRQLEPVGSGIPDWITNAAPFQDVETDAADKPSMPPLFQPAWQKTILTALMATSRAMYPDIERMVELVARGAPVQPSPMRSRARQAAAVSVLLDSGEAMEPFAEDEKVLLDALRRFVPPASLTAMGFDNCPTHGVYAPEGGDWDEFVTPAPGTLVLVVSDLASGFHVRDERVGVEDWIFFFRSLETSGCPSIVLTPYPVNQIAPALRSAVTVALRDRGTTAASAKRSRESVLRRLRQ